MANKELLARISIPLRSSVEDVDGDAPLTWRTPLVQGQRDS